MDTRCILVDGSSFFYRAFHALPPLINSKGLPTGAIYGVANMLKKMMQQHQPEFIGVIFDAPGKTFREDIYPDYKAHRPPTPSDLKIQYEPLIKLIQCMGLPVYAIPDVEADDVIATLAKQAESANIPVCIATGDKDFAQIVNPHICLYNSMTEQWLDEGGIEEKYGIKPSQFIDYLTLMGDTVDNIPGVPKCGPKTATKWLQTYHNLENIISNANDISGKIGENLRQTIPFFEISKQLVTINCAVSLPFSVQDLKPQAPQHDHLLSLIQELEFKTWLKNLETTQANKSRSTTKTQIIQQLSELETWIAKADFNLPLIFDTETDSLDTQSAQLIGISLCTNDDNVIYIPLRHETSHRNLSVTGVLELLKPIFENPNILKLGQNIKYDIHVLANAGIALQGIASDTMLESYVLNSASNRHDLGTLAKKYLHLDSISYEDVAGKGAKQIPFAAVPIEKAAEYSGEDVNLTLQLHHYFNAHLEPHEKAILKTLELPLIQVLVAMERFGVAIDVNLLAQQSEILKTRLEHLQTRAWELAGQVFNLQSPKQLAEIFYDKMQLPIVSKTPSGQPSTAEDVLQTLAENYELPAIILEHRSLSKLVSTYLEALPKRMNPRTGRVHTSYNQAITSTGRLSSSDPNLQNIPVRNEEGRMIRRAFIARPEHVLVTADYSQIELRIMAHLSEDPLLLKAFNNNHDIHQATASEIFNIPIDEVAKEQRRHAKSINFGLIYGMSSFGLAKQLNISRKDAQTYIDRYFAKYAGVLRYMETTKHLAHAQGYVETLLGRRLYLPEIHSKNMARVKAAERTAINAPMQGTAADLIKKAMIDIHRWLNEHQNIRANMMMQVHDELVFEVHQEDVEAFKQILQFIMEHAFKLHVPLLVNIGQGQNWEEAH
jgi:DNA polymerase I